jgi:hypothetical protein
MRSSALVVIVGVLLCGCAGRSTYFTTVYVVTTDEPGEYAAWAVIDERHEGLFSTRGRVRNTPRLVCAAGRPAKVAVPEDGGDTGESLEAYIARQGEGKPTVVTYMREEGGIVLTRTEVRLPPLAPPAPEKVTRAPTRR